MVHRDRDRTPEKIDLVDMSVNCAMQVFVQSPINLQELPFDDVCCSKKTRFVRQRQEACKLVAFHLKIIICEKLFKVKFRSDLNISFPQRM